MSLPRSIALGAVCAAFAATAALSCPNEPSTTAAAAAPGLRPHPRAAEIVAYRPHAWRPVSFAAAPGSAGMTVSIDPVDGAMSVPAPGTLESALLESLGPDLTPVAITHRADGSVRAQLDERWESHAVATIGPDGKPHWTCVEGSRGAAQFMKQPVLPVATSPVLVREVK
jgi:hypothetical protein